MSSSSDLDFLNSLMSSGTGAQTSASNSSTNGISETTSASAVPEETVSASRDQLSSILRAIAISTGEEDASEYDDATVTELLQRLEQADGVTNGLEERLDGLLSQLDGMLEQLEPVAGAAGLPESHADVPNGHTSTAPSSEGIAENDKMAADRKDVQQT